MVVSSAESFFVCMRGDKEMGFVPKRVCGNFVPRLEQVLSFFVCRIFLLFFFKKPLAVACGCLWAGQRKRK
jgi:hypothetical protein